MDTNSTADTVIPTITVDTVDKTEGSLGNMNIHDDNLKVVKETRKFQKQLTVDMASAMAGSDDMSKVKAFFQKNRSKSADDSVDNEDEGYCDCDTCLLGFDDTQPDGIAKTRIKNTAVNI